MEYNFKSIGVVRSCFDEKFGIPRQSGLVPAAQARIELDPPYGCAEALGGLETFSHVWILFVFHANRDTAWRATVRPPRLGGNKRVGVFASRSGYRPNPIGLTRARLEAIGHAGRRWWIDVSGVDLLDGTPVLDIKPYLPYADAVADAHGGFAEDRPEGYLEVRFTPQARRACESDPGLAELVTQVLAQDPRPAYREGREPSGSEYGMRLAGHEVRWRVEGEVVEVIGVEVVGEG
ncbi:MAG: tRNA (N6-threonylcarbamoyladenosine(37)-N6)-methyltransferase TrmO [Gammaproteobacteria bacterium]|jgi:tRNA-Thr(GGU) m(6)t(6)A37 methyltransferase TsaA